MATADAIVIGGGLVGCSTAYHLAKAGLRVQLLERDGIGQATSANNFGLVWVQSKAPGYYLEYTMAGAAYYPEFLDAVGEQASYRRNGGLILFESEEHRDRIEALMAEQQRTPGFEVEILDARQVREFEPELSEAALGASYCPLDGHVDPRALVPAVARAAERAGAELRPATPANALRRAGSTWVVETTTGPIEAPAVVVCAGAWTPEVAQLAGVAVPIEPVKGQILITEPLPPVIHHPCLDFRQLPNGRVWLGSTREHAGFDLTASEVATERIFAHGIRFFPQLASARIAEVRVGIRPYPPDDVPILGAVPSSDGLYLAVSHSGISLGPIHGRTMAELVTTGTTSVPIDCFSLSRFGTT
ncbi:MAG: FAD-binding oxidoreductase [Chloroflexi bacterium]|nr:FAD-binding oxidoreductase [Chloroflexota bacterium]